VHAGMPPRGLKTIKKTQLFSIEEPETESRFSKKEIINFMN
jgi:hypothetical protein